MCTHLKLFVSEKLIFPQSGHKLALLLSLTLRMALFELTKFAFDFIASLRSPKIVAMRMLNAESCTFNYKLNTKLNVSEIGCRKYSSPFACKDIQCVHVLECIWLQFFPALCACVIHVIYIFIQTIHKNFKITITNIVISYTIFSLKLNVNMHNAKFARKNEKEKRMKRAKDA